MLSRVTILKARIDEKISEQLNVIIHHKRFQQLEATWRGINFLTNISEEAFTKKIKIKCLGLSVDELTKDMLTAIEFDQSQLFKKIYTEEFDMPGGEPFGILVADYSVSHLSINNKKTDSISVLAQLGSIAAAAFSPIIFSASPSLFGMEDFSQLEKDIDLNSLFSQLEYHRWNNFRLSEDSRFIGMVLPRAIMRNIKGKFIEKEEVPYFSEKIDSFDDYLWGNAGFCLAEVVVRSFSDTGWFLNIRGAEDSKGNRGYTSGFVKESFHSAKEQEIKKYISEINILDEKEDRLNKFGFIVLSTRNLLDGGVFYNIPSVQLVALDRKNKGFPSAHVSMMLHHLLCACRFAHYIKVIIRNKLGSFSNAVECKNYLENWILKYCASSTSNKTNFPLKNAEISVDNIKSLPGKYLCRLDITPHYQIDRVESSIKFRSRVAL